MSEINRQPREFVTPEPEPLTAQEVTDIIEQKKRVYIGRLIKNYGLTPSVAEDMYQDALLAVVEKAKEGKIDRHKNPAGYMQMAVQNRTSGHLSKASTFRELPITKPKDGADLTSEEIVDHISRTYDAHAGMGVVSSPIPDPETSTLTKEIETNVQQAIESFIDSHILRHEDDNPALIRAIVEERMLQGEASQREIAKRFEVDRSVVRRIEESAAKVLRKKLRKFTDIKKGK